MHRGVQWCAGMLRDAQGCTGVGRDAQGAAAGTGGGDAEQHGCGTACARCLPLTLLL